MEWTNVHLRFKEMKNGDVAVLQITHDLWCPTSHTIGFYLDGELYDQNALDGMHPDDMAINNITPIVEGFHKTGTSVINQIPYTDDGN
jgi:hypothetical protein